MSGPYFRESIRQTDRNSRWENRSASSEGPLNCLDEGGLAKLECLGDHPEIIEILEPAVGYAERYKRFEFLGHHRFDRICAEARRPTGWDSRSRWLRV